MSTQLAAEKMLETGLFYSALELGREFREGAGRAAGWLHNIRNSSEYKIIEIEYPEPRVKLLSINGRTKTIDQLQNHTLLFKRPSMLVKGGEL